jgi:hypothetical protein
MFIAVASCKKGTDSITVTSTGIIQKQGITTYQYGSHVLTDVNGKTIYALRCSRYNLDNYVNRKVDIIGQKITGYPIDGGPDYIEVSFIK